MFSAKNLFLAMMMIVTIYIGIGAVSFAIDVAAKIATRAVL